MTLDIERERREFEADFKEQMGIDVGRTFHSCYASSRVEDRWNGWLAAKRAAVGSAEPVAFAEKLTSRNQYDTAVADALGDDRTSLYAPPAPVSAELVDASDDAAKGNISAWLRRHAGGDLVMIPGRLAGQIADHIDKLASAPPSTDAKDSERLDWILEQAKLKTLPRGINHWAIDVALDAAGELDLGSVYLDGRAAIDAAIALQASTKPGTGTGTGIDAAIQSQEVKS